LGGGWWTGWGAARRRGAGARARARAGVWERGRGAGARVNQVSQMEEGGLVRARARAAVTSWPRPFGQSGRESRAHRYRGQLTARAHPWAPPETRALGLYVGTRWPRAPSYRGRWSI
jgi:hypothetical protein